MGVSKKSRPQRRTLQDLFVLEENFLSSPDSAALKSALIRAVDRQTDSMVVVKYWQKTQTSIDVDLRELWHHENRQGERVRAYPRAADVVVEVQSYGETDDAFYVVMPGDIAPLAAISRSVRSDHWLRNLQTSRHRLLLWKNLRRLAEALEAVHGQGLVHGRIDNNAVFSASATTAADFALGGFEFCLRVAEVEKAPLKAIARRHALSAVIFSFLDDWRALGRIFAELLHLDLEFLDDDDRRFTSGHPPVDLNISEIDLLRALQKPERNRVTDAQTVIGLIDLALRDLEAEVAASNSRYVLALRLGANTKLSSAICVAAGDVFDADDIDAQFEFARADMETGVSLSRLQRGDLKLLTETLVYDLHPLRSAGIDENWSIAVCEDARSRDDALLGRRESIVIPANFIEIIPASTATARLKALRADANDWDQAIRNTPDPDNTQSIHRGLLLVQIAEALFRAAEIAPVEVTNQRRQGGRHFVELAASESDVRLRLAEALLVDAPSRLLRRIFDREEGDLDAKWQLLEAASLGTTSRGIADVRFSRTAQKDNRRVYEFEVTGGALPAANLLHLRRADETGTEQVLRRRLRMLRTLSTQSELAKALVDPRNRPRSYGNDPVVEDSAFKALDSSKQDALRTIWDTGPNQFVVGPPGVGKTTLITEIVRRALDRDPTLRLLLSTQAHQALDHLAAAVQKALGMPGIESELVLVRSRADSGANLSGAQTPDRAKLYLSNLLDSPLGRSAPSAIRQSLANMVSAFDVSDGGRQKISPEALSQRRSFEATVLQSANVLFSTTNSGDLERLIDDRAQFDWAIIEEAAKATGPELLAPQLLSMRRLLIGDHNQLPPFDTDRVHAFLNDQTRVRQALNESDVVVGNIFRDFGLEELREAIRDDGALSEICEQAKRVLLLFENLVTKELDRQERSPQRRRVATELLEQHRMHPAIATVVSECFYDSRLKTSSARETEFDTTAPPFDILDKRLPDSPIVFIDTPYVQRAGSAREERPTYHNPTELKLVLSILGAIKANGDALKPPTLAVLSPYNQQVLRLGRAIEDRLPSELKNLNDFRHGASAVNFESTIDSFQGSEADIVVVSLVRNNDHMGRRALGILGDRRRMNVLLSRAKWKLVIVGSLEFLRVQGRRYRRSKYAGRVSPEFIGRMLKVFELLSKETMADKVTPLLTIVPMKDFVAGERLDCS